MSFHRFLLALGLTVSCIVQANQIASAQSSVLQGSVRNDYVSSVIRQEQAPVTVVKVRQAPTVRYVNRYVDRPSYRTIYVRDDRTFFQRHPKVKAAAIGGGVGAGVGAATGLITGHGVLRGALIGTGAGAGVGLVRSSHTLRRHPIMRNVATGTLVGVGIGGAAGHGSRRALQGAGIGAAIGLGASIMNGDFR